MWKVLRDSVVVIILVIPVMVNLLRAVECNRNQVDEDYGGLCSEAYSEDVWCEGRETKDECTKFKFRTF